MEYEGEPALTSRNEDCFFREGMYIQLEKEVRDVNYKHTLEAALFNI